MAVAFTFKVVTYVALLLVLCLLVLQGVSGVLLSLSPGCVSGNRCFYEKAAQSRKVVKGSLHGSTSSAGNRENFVGWELRTVPPGSDPLHHNGNSPKKPRTNP